MRSSAKKHDALQFQVWTSFEKNDPALRNKRWTNHETPSEFQSQNSKSMINDREIIVEDCDDINPLHDVVYSDFKTSRITIASPMMS